MMRTMKGVLPLCLAAALLAVTAQPNRAATTVPDDAVATAHDIYVVNNTAASLTVYVKDAAGRRYPLGRVARDAKRTLQVPVAIAEKGPFSISVEPVAPAWSPWTSTAAVGTTALDLPASAAVHLWVERDPDQTRVEIPGS